MQAQRWVKRAGKIRAAIQCVAVFEELELRRMLSASSVWSIKGTGHADEIVIQTNAKNAKQLQAVVNGKVVATRATRSVSGIKVLAGGGADDVSLDLGSGYDDLDTTLSGGAGDDTLTGGMGDDMLNGGDGSDLLEGNEGDDSLCGDDGNDTVAGGMGDDTLEGDLGRDDLSGGYGADDLEGDGSSDTLTGGDGADSLDGGSAKDWIYHEQHDYWHYSHLDVSKLDKRANPLVQVSDEDALKQKLIDAAVKQWQWAFGQPGYWWGPVMYGRDGGVYATNGAAGATAGAPSSDPSSHSGTNDQVTGVDEADIVKNDGQYIYTVQDGKLTIIDSWPADQSHVVSSTDVDGYASGLYLDGDRVTVVSSQWTYSPMYEPMAASDVRLGMPIFRPWYGGKSQTIVTVFDVSDRSSPSVVSKTTLDGSATDSRDINGHIYLVMSNDLSLPAPLQIPNPDGTTPPPDEGGGTTGDGEVAPALVSSVYWRKPSQYDYTYELEDAYRARLEAMSLSELLPGYSTVAGDTTTTGGLASIDKLYLPSSGKDLSSMFSIVAMNALDDVPVPSDSTSIVGMSGDVYASATSLYVASESWDCPMGDWEGDYQTDIYKFALDSDSVTFEGTGEVPGWITDQFSMDEEGDTFRIATTTDQDGQSNNIFVLQDTGDTLDPIGGLTDLAFDERIYAARFAGDRAYIVTFHQTDPLFTIDLSDPANPTLAGVLELPGYSSYLQPIDDTHLIGLGRDADAQGHVTGLKVSLFDVSDINNPKLVDTFKFDTSSSDAEKDGWWSDWNSSPAEWDHHAFSYFADKGVLAVPVLDWGWWNGDAKLEVLRVDPASGFTKLGEVSQDTQVLRSLQIDNYLYSLSEGDLKVVQLDDPSREVADVPLTTQQPPDSGGGDGGGVVGVAEPMIFSTQPIKL